MEKDKSLKSKVKKTTEDVLSGLHGLNLMEVQPEKKDYGEVFIFVFKVTSEQGKGRIVKGMCTRHEPLIPKCKLYTWAKALLGRRPQDGEVIDWAALVGADCIGEIEPKETSSGTFERVKRLFPERLTK